MIFITGDTHGEFSRFSTKKFPEQKNMTKNDYVIIVGDFGGIWDKEESPTEKYWLNWFENKSFTLLIVDGNHENFKRLNNYPEKNWNGGIIHEIRPNIFHLSRGQIFVLENKSFFTFGGGKSNDIEDGILEQNDIKIKNWSKDNTKRFRINNINWWKEELPTEEEMIKGLSNLNKNSFKVNYILTHSPYTYLIEKINKENNNKSNILTEYLQNIKNMTNYDLWIFGHLHIDEKYEDEKSMCIYKKLIKLT